jgi:hypothetical protein
VEESNNLDCVRRAIVTEGSLEYPSFNTLALALVPFYRLAVFRELPKKRMFEVFPFQQWGRVVEEQIGNESSTALIENIQRTILSNRGMQ